MTQDKISYHRELAAKYKAEGNLDAYRFHEKAARSYEPKKQRKPRRQRAYGDLAWIAALNRIKQ